MVGFTNLCYLNYPKVALLFIQIKSTSKFASTDYANNSKQREHGSRKTNIFM